jgi:hypothetical protein
MSQATFRLSRRPLVKAYHVLASLVTLSFHVDGIDSETLPATDPKSIELLTLAALPAYQINPSSRYRA